MKKFIIFLNLFLSLSVQAQDINTEKFARITAYPKPEIIKYDMNMKRLVSVKSYIDTHFKYIAEAAGKDYWKDPSEFERDNGGDCEDFAIYAAFELMKYGYKAEDMKLILSRKKNGEQHAILAVRDQTKFLLFTQKNERYNILDNQRNYIISDSVLKDSDYLAIVYYQFK